LGFVYAIGRHFYSVGYFKTGARGRLTGARVCAVGLVSLTALAFYTAFTIGGGVNGFLSLFKF